MTKTIEEAAKRFADMKTTKQAGSSVERDRKALLMTQFFRYALEELPLSERLSTEEKERVRKAYESISEYGKDKSEECASCANYAARVWMERIFGKELFERKEES